MDKATVHEMLAVLFKVPSACHCCHFAASELECARPSWAASVL